MSLVLYDQQSQQPPPAFVMIKAHQKGDENPTVDIATPINDKDVENTTLSAFLRSKLSTKLSYDDGQIMLLEAGATDVKEMLDYPLSMALQVLQGSASKTFTVKLVNASSVSQQQNSVNVDDFSYDDLEMSGYIQRNSVKVDDYIAFGEDDEKEKTKKKTKKVQSKSFVDQNYIIAELEDKKKKEKDRRRSSMKSRSTVDPDEFIIDLEDKKKKKKKERRRSTAKLVTFSDSSSSSSSSYSSDDDSSFSLYSSDEESDKKKKKSKKKDVKKSNKKKDDKKSNKKKDDKKSKKKKKKDKEKDKAGVKRSWLYKPKSSRK